MKPWVTHKKEKSMTSMEQMEAPRDRKIYSTCSSVEAKQEELLKNVKKFKRSNPLKSLSMSHFKTFTMEKWSKFSILEQDAVKNVKVKADKTSKNVSYVRVKVSLSKCIRWVPECINKSKSIVINAADKDR